jgi:DNA-binding NarL/FixJ family response regulator
MICGEVDQEVIDRLSELASGGLGTPVVLASEHAEIGDIRSLLAAGVSGEVSRDEAMVGLLPTIEAVLAGQVCFPAKSPRAEASGAVNPRPMNVIHEGPGDVKVISRPS